MFALMPRCVLSSEESEPEKKQAHQNINLAPLLSLQNQMKLPILSQVFRSLLFLDNGFILVLAVFLYHKFNTLRNLCFMFGIGCCHNLRFRLHKTQTGNPNHEKIDLQTLGQKHLIIAAAFCALSAKRRCSCRA